MPKIKDSQVIFCNVPKVHKDRQNLHVFELRTVDICRKIKSFSLFALYASDNRQLQKSERPGKEYGCCPFV